MPFSGLTSQHTRNLSSLAPGIVTAWPRQSASGAGWLGESRRRFLDDGGRVEPDGRRPGRKNHDRVIVGGGSAAMTYGGRNLLESMTVNSQGITYKLNTFGQRVSEAFSGNTTHYIHDINGNLIAEADGSTGTTTMEYAYAEGQPLAQIDGSGNIFYQHLNQVGLPQKMTDASRTLVFDQIIEPFGEVSSTPTNTTPTNIRFPGQYANANNSLYHNGNRDYFPWGGFYDESDPIGLAGGLNPLAYASQNPTERIDPLGLDDWVHGGAPIDLQAAANTPTSPSAAADKPCSCQTPAKVVINGSETEGSYREYTYQILDANGNPVGGPGYSVAEEVEGNVDNNSGTSRPVGKNGKFFDDVGWVPMSGYAVPDNGFGLAVQQFIVSCGDDQWLLPTVFSHYSLAIDGNYANTVTDITDQVRANSQ